MKIGFGKALKQQKAAKGRFRINGFGGFGGMAWGGLAALSSFKQRFEARPRLPASGGRRI